MLRITDQDVGTDTLPTDRMIAAIQKLMALQEETAAILGATRDRLLGAEPEVVADRSPSDAGNMGGVFPSIFAMLAKADARATEIWGLAERLSRI